MSATEITLGLVVSKTSPLGPETFTGPMYGALAYVAGLNGRGGIAGRRVRVIVCDDGSTAAGNRRCVHKLIDDDKVFAFVGNSIFDYGGASYVQQRAVPDVGGQPISDAYEQYSHLFQIYGTSSPRDGTVGDHGTLYGGTEVYRYFKETLGARVAGVLSFNQVDSQRYANLLAAALEVEGYTVVREQLDFAVPNYDAAAIDMRAHHVDIVFDGLDATSNAAACKAIDAARLTLKAKVVTVQGWTDAVRTDYQAAKACRNAIYATATARSYEDVDHPTVRQFRDEMHAAYPDRDRKLSMWTEEGWASAQWFADAAATCGADLTRVCVEAFLDRPTDYDGHGLLTPRNFTVRTGHQATEHNCLSAAQWQDSANGGTGGWVTRTPNKDFLCYDVPTVAYTP